MVKTLEGRNSIIEKVGGTKIPKFRKITSAAPSAEFTFAPKLFGGGGESQFRPPPQIGGLGVHAHLMPVSAPGHNY